MAIIKAMVESRDGTAAVVELLARALREESDESIDDAARKALALADPVLLSRVLAQCVRSLLAATARAAHLPLDDLTGAALSALAGLADDPPPNLRLIRPDDSSAPPGG